MTTHLRRSSPAEAAAQGLAWAVYPSDRTTPVRAFESLRGGGKGAVLLESVDGPRDLARFSFLCIEPDGALRIRGGRGTLTTQGAAAELAGLTPLEGLRRAREATADGRPRGAEAHPDLPPFTGGWIGFVSYETAHGLEPTVAARAAESPAADEGFADLHFDHHSVVLAFDQRARTVTVTVRIGPGRDARDAAEHVERVAARAFGGGGGTMSFRAAGGPPHARVTRAAFEASVERIKGEIGRGEVFQCVLSQGFDLDFEGDPFVLYRALRMVNPAPHMFFFDSGEVQLVGSSPERLVSVGGGALELVPIAGTRPRGADGRTDAALAAALRSDPKERAEHDMLVDLARNDAGRVARVGSVEVSEYQTLLRLPRVQHLVSRVTAELAAGRDALDALGAAFPAGTVSGAPKVRAMQLIHREEGTPRGPYGGAFGYLDEAGDLDMALAIRTVVCRRGRLTIQAGAGIVHDSDPAAEYEETLHKARALFEAVELAGSAPFQPSAATRTELAEVAR